MEWNEIIMCVNKNETNCLIYIFFFSKQNWHQNYDMIIEMQPDDLACAVAGLTFFFN